MSAVDTSQEMTIGLDWARSLALLLTCVIVLVAFTNFIQDDGTRLIDRRARFAAHFVLPIFAVFTPWVLFRLFVPFGPLLRIGPDGFSDGRVNKDLVPWPEVSNIVARSEVVTLTLSLKFARSYRMSLGQKFLKRRRKAGPSHLVIATSFLASTEPHLKDILAAYCVANGGTSSPTARRSKAAVTS